MGIPGYEKLMDQVSGLTLGNGLMRFFTHADGPVALRLLKDAFPEFSTRAVPFARDWLGRQFALDLERTTGTAHQLLLLEPGSGEVFDIDEGFESFLNVDLVED